MSTAEWTAAEDAAFRKAAGDTQAADWLLGRPMDPLASPAEVLPALPGLPFLHAGAGAVIVGPTGGGRSSLIEAALYDSTLYAVRSALPRLRGHRARVQRQGCAARRAALRRRRRGPAEQARARPLPRAQQRDRPGMGRAEVWIENVVENYDLIAIDPLSAVASALDLDFDQRNVEFIRFYDRLIAPITSRGVAVVMIDNTGHAIEAKNRPKGASAKQDRADLTFSCSFSSQPEGLIVKAHKVRSVRAGFARGDEWIFLKDAQRIEARGASHTGPFRPTAYMERVSKVIESQPGLSKRGVRESVHGKNPVVDLALELLINEEYVEAKRDGQAVHHYPKTAYREAEDA